jgi:hypothetical protein
MIRDKEYFMEFEKKLLEEGKTDFARNLEIYEAMWLEAVELGILPLKDPYDGLEVDIRLAKILNRQPPVHDQGLNHDNK